jgi:2-iminobutanoate/2-iminopropanoate deaminase
MTRDARQPDGLARPKAPYSPVVVSGDQVYTAGQVAFDPNGELVPGGVEEQTRQVFANLRSCLEAAGCTFDDVVKVNAFLTDLDNFAAFNAVYAEHFSAPYPVRTTVQAGLAPGLLVEVEVVARLRP